MNRTFRTILVASAALLASTACTDPTVAPKSTINSETVFSEPSAYRSLLAKVYAGLAVTGQQGCCGSPDISGIDEGFSQYWRLYWQMQTLPTDDAIIAWGDQALSELQGRGAHRARSHGGLPGQRGVRGATGGPGRGSLERRSRGRE